MNKFIYLRCILACWVLQMRLSLASPMEGDEKSNEEKQNSSSNLTERALLDIESVKYQTRVNVDQSVKPKKPANQELTSRSGKRGSFIGELTAIAKSFIIKDLSPKQCLEKRLTIRLPKSVCIAVSPIAAFLYAFSRFAHIETFKEMKTVYPCILSFEEKFIDTELKLQDIGLPLGRSSEVAVSKSFAVQVEPFDYSDQFASFANNHNIERINKGDIPIKTFVPLVNEEISKATEGNVTNLLTEDSLRDAKFLYILVLHLRIEWETEFASYETTTKDFRKSDREAIRNSFMREVGQKRVYQENDLQITSKDLRHGLEAVFIMRKGNYDCSNIDLEEALSFFDNSEKTHDMGIELHLPKVSVKTEIDIEEHLKDMGINKLFNSDFGMDKIKKSGSNFFVSKIKMASYFEMNEKGIVAGAVISTICFDSSRSCVSTVVSFDYPFLIILRRKQTKTILFVTSWYGE